LHDVVRLRVDSEVNSLIDECLAYMTSDCLIRGLAVSDAAAHMAPDRGAGVGKGAPDEADLELGALAAHRHDVDAQDGH
jgi:hypothetical protein